MSPLARARGRKAKRAETQTYGGQVRRARIVGRAFAFLSLRAGRESLLLVPEQARYLCQILRIHRPLFVLENLEWTFASLLSPVSFGSTQTSSPTAWKVSARIKHALAWCRH